MRSTPRKGQIITVVVGLAVLVAVVGLAGLALRGLGSNGKSGKSSDTWKVRRGSFDITLPVTGELAAMDQIEVRNKLDQQAIITEIVPEGQWVEEGDVLLRLNDDEIRNRVDDATDAVNLAEADKVAASSELDVMLKERDSEMDKARLAVQLADLALDAWRKGEDIAKRRELALALETAQMNFARLEARFEESKALLDKKFISRDEYKQDEISKIEAAARLEQAALDIDLYENYQFHQDKAQIESDLKQAQDELERTEQRFTAKIQKEETSLESKKFQLESKRDRLRQLQEKLENCTILAPSPGLVVYYTSLDTGRWGNDENPPQVGTQLWPNQTVIVLPDTSRMVAAVKISEVLSGQIKPGQMASIVSDARPDSPLTGEVISVGVLAQSGGWRDPNRRDYTVRIALDDVAGIGLKPSMRCKAQISVGRVDDALYIPVQAVNYTGPLPYVYVPDGRGWAQSKVAVGRSSELFLEVTEGVSEGDVVLLREPDAAEITYRLPAPKRENTPQIARRRPQPGKSISDERNPTGAVAESDQSIPLESAETTETEPALAQDHSPTETEKPSKELPADKPAADSVPSSGIDY